MTNNRKHQRFTFDSDVEFNFQDKKYQGRAVNISQGGILIVCDEALSFGSKVTLYLSLPKVPEVCEIPCIVRWSGEKNQTGLQFEHLRAKEVWGITKLLHTLKPADQ